jgi:hypothetical protein
MRTLDEMLAAELHELAKSPEADDLLALVLRAAAVLSRDGEQRALTRIGAVLGAAAVVLQRGEDRSFGLLFRASRAILNRAAVGVRQNLVRFTIDELLLSLGAERAEHRAARLSLDDLEVHVLNLRGDRARLEGDNARLRAQLSRLEDAENARDAAVVERDVARAHLRDAGIPAHRAPSPVSDSAPASVS